MRIDVHTTLPDLAFIVCTTLKESGQTVILSGGGAATVWAPQSYVSKDLDFIFEFWSAFSPSEQPMFDLGFRKEGSIFVHDQTKYTVDFPVGPLAIGNDDSVGWTTLHQGKLHLNILSPTDSVRDRLAWFFLEEDYNALDQALFVALAQTIDFEAVEAWARTEREYPKYARFKARYDQGG